MGFSNRSRAIAVAVCVVIAAGSGEAQSIVTFQNEVVTYGGAPVPGIPGASFSTGANMTLPFMQDDGRVLFHGRFSGGGAQFFVNDAALFYGDKSNLTKVLRWGDAEPSGTLPGATVTQIFPDHALGANGMMIFGGRVAGPGITFSNDSSLFAGTPENLQLIARETTQAADSPPGALYGSQEFGQTMGILHANASGHIAFSSDLTGALTGKAVFAGAPGALVRVMTVGEVVGTNLTIGGLPSLVQINSAGQVLMDLVTRPAPGPRHRGGRARLRRRCRAPPCSPARFRLPWEGAGRMRSVCTTSPATSRNGAAMPTHPFPHHERRGLVSSRQPPGSISACAAEAGIATGLPNSARHAGLPNLPRRARPASGSVPLVSSIDDREQEERRRTRQRGDSAREPAAASRDARSRAAENRRHHGLRGCRPWTRRWKGASRSTRDPRRPPGR